MPVPTKELFINKSNMQDIGEFMGIFAGDGNYSVDKDYRHQIRIFLNSQDKKYVVHVANLIRRLFSKDPWIYTRDTYNVTMIRVISKELLLFIKNYLQWDKSKTFTVRLVERNNQLDKDFVVGYLRGLIDTDGYLDRKNKLAKYCTISEESAKDIEFLLFELGIKNSCYIHKDKRGNRKPTFRISVSKDFERFINIIKPFHFNYTDALVV